MPDNGAHVSAQADLSNDLMGLAFGAGFEMSAKFFEDVVLVFKLFKTALYNLGVCLGN